MVHIPHPAYGGTGEATHCNTHTTSTRDKPAPNCRSRTAGRQGEHEGRHDGGKQATDADGEGESREVAKLSLKHGLVSKLGRELGVLLADLFEVENLPLPARAGDLNQSHAPLAVAHLAHGGAGVIGVENCCHCNGRVVSRVNPGGDLGLWRAGKGQDGEQGARDGDKIKQLIAETRIHRFSAGSKSQVVRSSIFLEDAGGSALSSSLGRRHRPQLVPLWPILHPHRGGGSSQ